MYVSYQQLVKPLRQALEAPAQLSLQDLKVGLSTALQYLQTNMQLLESKAADYRSKAADKAAKWVRQRIPDQSPAAPSPATAFDDDRPVAAGASPATKLSHQQMRELGKLDRQAQDADGSLVAGRLITSLLGEWLKEQADSSLLDGQLRPQLLPIVARLLQSMEDIVSCVRLAADKLLVFKLQTLDNAHSDTVMRLFVKH
jgi:hypothetical protein